MSDKPVCVLCGEPINHQAQRIEALEGALRDIIKQQNVAGQSLSAYSRTVEIARTALAKQE